MRSWLIGFSILLCGLMFLHSAKASGFPLSSKENGAKPRAFMARGVIQEIQFDAKIINIQHEAISNYMDAMTMPFKVKTQTELAGFQRGDKITFQLHVTDTESWVDQLQKIGSASVTNQSSVPAASEIQAGRAPELLLDYKFTNELGQAISLNDFRGQALAVTFFYTRCPLPEFCPRLSKNFQAAAQKLKVMPHAPVNWHFLSISFDTEFDSPGMLKAYGESYHYDPAHWSFLTGSPDKIAELAQGCGVNYQFDTGTFNHNFRTLIVDRAGHLQMIFPMGGDLSDAIVEQIVKAAAVTNQPVPQN